jgi:hypothetical protein
LHFIIFGGNKFYSIYALSDKLTVAENAKKLATESNSNYFETLSKK